MKTHPMTIHAIAEREPEFGEDGFTWLWSQDQKGWYRPLLQSPRQVYNPCWTHWTQSIDRPIFDPTAILPVEETREPSIRGKLIRAGDLDVSGECITGILIQCTREEIESLHGNMMYRDVVVTAAHTKERK